jgi:hypothetical protein
MELYVCCLSFVLYIWLKECVREGAGKNYLNRRSEWSTGTGIFCICFGLYLYLSIVQIKTFRLSPRHFETGVPSDLVSRFLTSQHLLGARKIFVTTARTSSQGPWARTYSGRFISVFYVESLIRIQ